MEIIQVQQRIEGCMDKINPVLKEYHKAKSEYENIKEMQKTMLAVYELKHSDKSPQDSIKRHALADDDYKEFLEGLKEAREKFNRAWALLEALRIEVDLLRSLNKHLN